VLIVENDPVKVESDLVAGLVACPGCGGHLARWGFARVRRLRDRGGPVLVRPRRGRCCSCRRTQVLLADIALVRRVDTVAVVGRACRLAAGGMGQARVAVEVGRPISTVRGWLRRFRAAAVRVAAHFGVWAHRLDPNLGPIGPAGSRLADALEAVGVAARAASLRLGSRPAWSWASV
jgi:hypothetical protein